MSAYSFYVDFGRGRVEVFELKVAKVAAIHRVSPLAAELLDVEVVGSHAYFLVRVEAHTYVAVLHFVVVPEPAHSLHNLCNARLVVSTQQGVPVGDYDVLTLVGKKLREFLCR